MPLLLIHPKTADVFMAGKGDGALARHLILDGYEPVGPRGQAAAARIRQDHADAQAAHDLDETPHHAERPDRYDDRGDDDDRYHEDD